MAKDSRSTFPIIDENGCPVDPTIFPRYNLFCTVPTQSYHLPRVQFVLYRTDPILPSSPGTICFVPYRPDPTIFPRYNLFCTVPTQLHYCNQYRPLPVPFVLTSTFSNQCSLYQPVSTLASAVCTIQYRPQVLLWHEPSRYKDTSLILACTNPSSVPVCC